MTATVTRFEGRLAPCGELQSGERSVNEDGQGLSVEEVLYDCGCRMAREEFHDGSVHDLIVRHDRTVLMDEEFRGE
jgi:hypothetical protein